MGMMASAERFGAGSALADATSALLLAFRFAIILVHNLPLRISSLHAARYE